MFFSPIRKTGGSGFFKSSSNETAVNDGAESSDEELFEEMTKRCAESPSPESFAQLFCDTCTDQEITSLFRDFCRQNDADDNAYSDFEEQEKGYHAAMKKAFLCVISTLKQPLTAGLLQQYHRMVTENVAIENAQPGKFRSQYVYFGLGKDNASLDGLIEILTDMHAAHKGKNPGYQANFCFQRDGAGSGDIKLSESDSAHFYLEDYEVDINLEEFDIINDNTIGWVVDFIKREKITAQDDESAIRWLAELILSQPIGLDGSFDLMSQQGRYWFIQEK